MSWALIVMESKGGLANGREVGMVSTNFLERNSFGSRYYYYSGFFLFLYIGGDSRGIF